MKPNHTPEPWYEGHSSSGQGIVISENDGKSIAVTYDDKDASRIVACVNACTGIPTEALEAGVIGEVKDALQHAASSVHHPACKCNGEYSANPEMYCTCHVQKARAVLDKVK